jgi:hypothetical protein
MVDRKLATLFIKYYAFVKKEKNIDCEIKHFLNDDYNDIQEALLLFMLHLAEDEQRKEMNAEQITDTIVDLCKDYDESDRIKEKDFEPKEEIFKLE